MTDCIEREAAFNAILKLVPKVDGDGYCWVIRGDAARAIDSIPSADVTEVRHGKWEDNGGDRIELLNGLEIFRYKCSECGYVFTKIHVQPLHNFCPNCGSYNGGEHGT